MRIYYVQKFYFENCLVKMDCNSHQRETRLHKAVVCSLDSFKYKEIYFHLSNKERKQQCIVEK